MCCNRSLYHKINHLHERCLPMIYSDKKSGFDELHSGKDGTVSPLTYVSKCTMYQNVQRC